MKKLAMIWIVLAAIFAIVTTIMDIEPASTFIGMALGSDGRYMIMIPVGLTFIICMIPLFIIMVINNIVQGKKNKFPTDLSGKTGIVVKREKELTNAALMYDVLINGEYRAKLGMSKRIFIELLPGEYQVQIKLGKKICSSQLSIKLEQGKILAFQTKMDINKSLTTLVPKGEMLFLVQVPFSI